MPVLKQNLIWSLRGLKEKAFDATLFMKSHRPAHVDLITLTLGLKGYVTRIDFFFYSCFHGGGKDKCMCLQQVLSFDCMRAHQSESCAFVKHDCVKSQAWQSYFVHVLVKGNVMIFYLWGQDIRAGVHSLSRLAG